MTDLRDLDLLWRHETEKAILVAKVKPNGLYEEVWLPKRAIDYERYSTETLVAVSRVWVSAPLELLVEKKLDDQIGAEAPHGKPRPDRPLANLGSQPPNEDHRISRREL